MKMFGVKDYTNKGRMEQMSKFNTPKIWKYLWNVHKLVGAHLQCLNTYHTKFEHKGTKDFEVKDNTN